MGGNWYGLPETFNLVVSLATSLRLPVETAILGVGDIRGLSSLMLLGIETLLMLILTILQGSPAVAGQSTCL
jgi:hypothetical protein